MPRGAAWCRIFGNGLAPSRVGATRWARVDEGGRGSRPVLCEEAARVIGLGQARLTETGPDEVRALVAAKRGREGPRLHGDEVDVLGGACDPLISLQAVERQRRLCSKLRPTETSDRARISG